MFSGLSVSCVSEVIGAFFGGVGAEKFANGGDEGFDGSGRGFAQEMLELGEHLLDRVQIGRVFGQEEELGAGRPESLANGFAFVAAEIVQDHQITWPKGGNQHFLDVGSEALAVDRTVDEPGRIDAIVTQRGDEGRGLLVAMRNLDHEPFALRRPSPKRLHVGLRPRLVDEDQTSRIDLALTVHPLDAPPRDVRSVAFAGDHGFF
jgi:hypothetical protein